MTINAVRDKDFKIIIFLLLSFFLLHCSSTVKQKEYEPNSKEAKKTIEWIMNAKLDEAIDSCYVYVNRTGIDPFYFAKFNLVNIKVSEILDSTWSVQDPAPEIYISDKAPNWYTPKMETTSSYYLKKFNGGSKTIVYHPDNKTCFLTYITY